ncbi:MAG: NTP transferase domain-containing protein [Bdellovibrionales bacterium]|nr:NTP transferase domain-containing protein [Bdellovibrionales bacterium]
MQKERKTAVILAAGKGTRIKHLNQSIPKPLLKLCGLSLIERTIKSLSRVGISEIVVVIDNQDNGKKIQEALGNGSRYQVQIHYAINPDNEKPNGYSLYCALDHVKTESFFILMSDHVLEPKFYQMAEATSHEKDSLILFVDHNIESVFDLPDATKVQYNIETSCIEKISKNLPQYNAIDTGIFLCHRGIFSSVKKLHDVKNGDFTLSNIVELLAEKGHAKVQSNKNLWWQDVDTQEAYDHAEKKMLKMQIKDSDTWVSRHMNRPVSLFFSRFFLKTPITPNHISVMSCMISLLAPLFLIQGTYWGFLLGALVYHMASVLDGSDGEVARLKMQEATSGEWVDTLSDIASHFFFLGGLVFGLYRRDQSPIYFLLGIISLLSIGSLLLLLLNYIKTVAKRGSLLAFKNAYETQAKSSGGSAVWFSKLTPLIQRATYALLFVIFALINVPEITLYALAIGPLAAFFIIYFSFFWRRNISQ